MAKRSLSDGDLRHILNDIRSTARPLARRDGHPPSRRLVTPTQNKRRRVYIDSHEEKPTRKIAKGSWAMMTIATTLGQGKSAKRHNSETSPDDEETVSKRRSVHAEEGSAPRATKESSFSAPTLTADKPQRKPKKAKGKKKSKHNMLVRASPGSCDISMSQEEKIVELEVDLSALQVSSDKAVTNAAISHENPAPVDRKETSSSSVTDLTVKPMEKSFSVYRLPTIKVTKAAGPLSKIRAKPAKRIAEKDAVQEFEIDELTTLLSKLSL